MKGLLMNNQDIAETLRGIRRNGSWSALKPRGNEAHPVCYKAASVIDSLREDLEQAAAAERAKVVAWLRDRVRGLDRCNEPSEFAAGLDEACDDFEELLDAIEALAHHEGDA